MSTVPPVTSAPIALAHVAARDWIRAELAGADPAITEIEVRLRPGYAPAEHGRAIRIPPAIGTAEPGLPTGDALLKFHCYGRDDADAALLALVVADRLHTLSHARMTAYGVVLAGAYGLQTYASPEPAVNAQGGTVGSPAADRYIVSAYVTVGPITAS